MWLLLVGIRRGNIGRLGGGEVDLKMRVDVTELVTKLVYEQAGRPPSFADITED